MGAPVSIAATPLPARRDDLQIENHGRGRHVVKDPRSGSFFLLEDQEHFLLLQLDGRHEAAEVCEAFEHEFRESLPQQDLDAFIETARDQGILTSSAPPARPRQSIFYWRKSIWNPDSVFQRLEPKIRVLWTRGFLILSGVSILLTGFLLWVNRAQLVVSMRDAIRWESVIVGWVVLVIVRGLHECAHGLTCKHHGGKVTEIGVLFLLFTPCFYCNVSDAWMFRERGKRISVMLAGAYCDLCVWALAIVAWRLTEPGTLIHRVAFLILGLSGIDSLFNFNPLIKLDGYYVLSDWAEVPNLQQRSIERVRAMLRWLLWGAERPERHERARFLTVYGILSWCFSVTFLAATFLLFTRWLRDHFGVAGTIAGVILVTPAVLSLFYGVCGGEVRRMIMRRHARAICWMLGLGGVVAALCLIKVDEYSGGTFTVRPTVREEIRCRVAGFMKEIPVNEGQRLSAGDVIARLEVPDLDCRLAQRRAELREAEAQLHLLESGARPEEIAYQKGRVERMERWHAQSKSNVERMQKMVDEELRAFDERIAEAEIVRDAADATHARIESLFKVRASSADDLEKADTTRNVARRRISVAASEKRACAARGTSAADEELAEREKELGDERGRLALLEAGPRPEEVAAQKARTDRMKVEIAHLERLREMLEVRTSVAGTVVTSRLQERIGTYVREGDVLCVVEGADRQEAEISLEEEKLRGIHAGQTVMLKARALAFETLEGRVTGIAYRAAKEEAAGQCTVPVYCSLDCTIPVLRTSMSGYARIYTGRRSVGAIVLERVMRIFRTEFWW